MRESDNAWMRIDILIKFWRATRRRGRVFGINQTDTTTRVLPTSALPHIHINAYEDVGLHPRYALSLSRICAYTRKRISYGRSVDPIR